jgi:hypothetical protein
MLLVDVMVTLLHWLDWDGLTGKHGTIIMVLILSSLPRFFFVDISA